MAIPAEYNNIPVEIGEQGDPAPWGPEYTQLLTTIMQGSLVQNGDNFSLSTVDGDFGALFGIMAIYLKSRTADIASAGFVRAAVSDVIAWRNNADDGNLLLGVNGSDRLIFDGAELLTKDSPTEYVASITGTANQVIASAATGAVTLSLPQDIAVGSSPTFVTETLSGLTASRAIITNGSKVLASSATSDTELGYVAGVTSAIQTQINTKAPSANPTFTGTVTVPNGSGNTDAAAYGQVPTLTAWVSWTPTFTNLGTVGTISAWWRRVGDTIEVRGTAVAGSTAGATAKMTLPNSYTIDTAKCAANAVFGWFLGGGGGNPWWSTNFVAVPFYDGSDNTALFFAKSNSGGSLTKQNGNNFASANELFSFGFAFPATGLGVH